MQEVRLHMAAYRFQRYLLLFPPIAQLLNSVSCTSSNIYSCCCLMTLNIGAMCTQQPITKIMTELIGNSKSLSINNPYPLFHLKQQCIRHSYGIRGKNKHWHGELTQSAVAFWTRISLHLQDLKGPPLNENGGWTQADKTTDDHMHALLLLPFASGH